MYRWWWLLILLAFILRAGGAWFWEYRFIPARLPAEVAHDGDGPFFFGDSDSYWKLGRTIAMGRPYQFDEKRHWTVFRMPGYPVLLAPMFLVAGEHPPEFPARIINCILGTFAVALVGLLAFVIFRDQQVAILAAALAAIDPCSILQSVLLLSEAGFSVAMLFQMILFVSILNKTALFRASEQNDQDVPENDKCFVYKVGIWLGLAWAVSVYFRPSWLYFVPFLFVLLFFGLAMKKSITSKIGQRVCAIALITGLVFCFAMSPWWIRNAKITGRFVPTTLQLGASLYDGLSPLADGSSNMSFVDTFRQEEIESPIPGTEQEHFEVRLDRRMKNASVTWSRTHPGQVIRLAGVKFLRLWNIVPNEASFSSRSIRAIIFLSYTPVLCLAILGLICCRRQYCVCILLLAPAIYITLLHVIFVSSLRYRTPAMLVLMVVAAWTIIHFWRHIKRPS